MRGERFSPLRPLRHHHQRQQPPPPTPMGFSYLCKGALESPCTTISASLSISAANGGDDTAAEPAPHSRQSGSVATGRGERTARRRSRSPPHASYITEQMTSKQPHRGGRGGLKNKEEGGGRSGSSRKGGRGGERAAVQREVGKCARPTRRRKIQTCTGTQRGDTKEENYGAVHGEKLY